MGAAIAFNKNVLLFGDETLFTQRKALPPTYNCLQVWRKILSTSTEEVAMEEVVQKIYEFVGLKAVKQCESL